jgi:hypothetical protein
MKSNRMTVFGIVFLATMLLIGGAILWLGNTPMKPPTQTVKQAIPDDRIPR